MSSTSGSLYENPLGVPPRERAGAQTFEKYEYQYHWALCRILVAHEKPDDYVVFVELHEDVVLATSTDVSLARFEFSQIKNNNRFKGLRQKELTRVPKSTPSTGETKNSILGKMLNGVRGRPFEKKLDSLDLVATCGFDLPLKNDDLALSIISMGDLHDDCLEKIQAAIDEELGAYPLPKILKFIKPDLVASGFQDTTIGRISKLVDVQAGGTKCDAVGIYRVLIDDLHRKGTVAFDFIDWNHLVSHKGTTRCDVEKVISSYVDKKGIEAFEKDLDDVLQDLGLKLSKRMQMRRAFERYHNAVRFGRSQIAIDSRQSVRAAVESNLGVFEKQSVKDFMDLALENLPEVTKSNLGDSESAQAAIIYELLSIYHEKSVNHRQF
ncbi:DUF4297 domain-containing protein [Carnimonas bestiolae]|uniref:DUF4297 domain-containing protein n=1 Tax=Carnimonas bestiolae TaxID=3402172 RepID=UPI003F4A879B